MIEPIWFLLGALLPAVAAGGVVGSLTRRVNPNAAWSAATALGFAIGYCATDGWPPFPPRESHHWLVVGLLPAALVAEALPPWGRAGRRGAWLVRAALLLGWPPLLLQSYLKYNWSPAQAALWLTALAAVGGVLFSSTAGASRQARGKPVVFALGLVAAATGILLMLSGSATLGQLGLALACTLGGAWAAMLVRGGDPPTVGLLATILLLMGLWANGYFYASLTPLRAACLCLAPLGVWLGRIPMIKGRPLQLGVSLAGVATPLSVALIDAVLAFAAEMNDPGVPY